jgi:hypothetical protein
VGILVGVILFVVGLVFQAGLNRRDRSRKSEASS